MEAEIGSAAGIVWRYLDQHGEMTVSKLKQATELSDQLLFKGIGWLAREGRLTLVKDSRTLKVGLKER